LRSLRFALEYEQLCKITSRTLNLPENYMTKRYYLEAHEARSRLTEENGSVHRTDAT